jgi:hypothetical protein
MRLVIPSQNGFTEPFFKTGIAFEARVVTSQKREGVVRQLTALHLGSSSPAHKAAQICMLLLLKSTYRITTLE